MILKFSWASLWFGLRDVRFITMFRSSKSIQNLLKSSRVRLCRTYSVQINMFVFRHYAYLIILVLFAEEILQFPVFTIIKRLPCQSISRTILENTVHLARVFFKMLANKQWCIMLSFHPKRDHDLACSSYVSFFRGEPSDPPTHS
jgi:hypothetical protein